MKKQDVLKTLLHFPIGIAIGQVIVIIISLILGDGYFIPVTPALTKAVGSEVGAVILQTILCGVMGSAHSVASAVFENDNWSRVKQTLIHFCITSFIIMPIAYVLHWIPSFSWGFIVYFAVMVIIYIFIWLINYLVWRYKIKSLNKKLNEIKG